MKLFTPRTLILILLILSNAGISYSQDTTKKVVTAKPVVTKPVVKYNPYAKKYLKPAATATQTPGTAPVTPAVQRPAATQVATDKSLAGAICGGKTVAPVRGDG